ncbi:hypothetical protein DL93DRAFT_2170869 [Clavulina sp. PMI_390]|nr:hypothetical protein DL93DRAFT_2170869 [Clavulina sp. PMI_390]
MASIENLPFELIANIFSHGMPVTAGIPDADDPSKDLMGHTNLIQYLSIITSLSSYLRHIALQTPRLWATVLWGHSEMTALEPNDNVVVQEQARFITYLERSRNTLISVSFYGLRSSLIQGEEAWRILVPHLPRCQHLSLIMSPSPYLANGGRPDVCTLGLCMPLPNIMVSLEALNIHGGKAMSPEKASIFSVELTTPAPNLRELRIDVPGAPSPLLRSIDSLKFPNLSDITLIDMHGTSRCALMWERLGVMASTLRRLKLSYAGKLVGRIFAENPIEFPILEQLEITADWDFSFAKHFITPSLQKLSLTRSRHPTGRPSHSSYESEALSAAHCLWPQLTSLSINPLPSEEVGWVYTVLFALLRAHPLLQRLDFRMNSAQARRVARFLTILSPSLSVTSEVDTDEDSRETAVPRLRRLILRSHYGGGSGGRDDDWLQPEEIAQLLRARPHLYARISKSLMRAMQEEFNEFEAEFRQSVELFGLGS